MREARLAKEWGVSRTPVREAVRQAVALGLIELRPNRAPVVRVLSPADVENLYALRETLEVFALDLSFDKIPPQRVKKVYQEVQSLDRAIGKPRWRRRALALDTALHQLWIAHCGNRWLQQSISQLWTFIKILQQIVAKDEMMLDNSIAEHTAILDALSTGDKLATRRALVHHIRSSAEYLNRQLPASDSLSPKASF